MKKVLEAELLSMAHRILQMKNKDVDHLYEDAKKLYEQLLILKFYQDNFEKGLIQDITQQQLEDSLQKVAIADVDVEQNAEERLQMPNDLIEDEYPIVVDVDKEPAISAGIQSDLVQKIAQEVPEHDSSAHNNVQVNYSSEFIEDKASAIQDELTQEVYDFLIAQEGNEELDTEVLPEEPKAIVQEFDQEPVGLSQTDFVVSDVQRAVEQHDPQHDLKDQDQVSIVHGQEELVQEIEEFQQQAQDFVVETKLNDTSEVAISEPKIEEPIFQEIKQIEDDPFSGFNFMDLAFQRVEQNQEELSKSALAGIEDSPIEEAISQAASVIEEDANELGQQQAENPLFNIETQPVTPIHTGKAKSINDIYSSTITVGLNDRIAFEKNLFGGSSEDFNRVLSQLNTVSTYDEALSLIEHLIKPEYNNWEGKTEYEERFMDIVEKRFI